MADLARARGVVLAKSGDNLLGLCPFHADREPSLVVTPSSNLWHCLGACQTGGSVIDFVMKAEGVSFRHAVELLQAGVTPVRTARETASSPRHSTRRKLEPLAPLEADSRELLGRVMKHYQAARSKNREAVAYLESRGIGVATAEQFGLGFSDRTLGYRLPANHNKGGQELRTKLTELGVLRETGHEHLRGCVVVPLLDAEGHVVQMYGRKIDDKSQPHHLYLAGRQRGVFNGAGLAGSDEVIVCEALMDALTFCEHGFRNVTSGYGADGVTDEVLEAIVSSGAKVVKIAFDRDEAGDRGAEKLAERVAARGLEAHRVLVPKGMDANEYARKVEPGTASLKLVLNRSEWMRGSGARRRERQEAAREPDVVDEAKAEETTGESPSLVASPSSLIAASEPEPIAGPTMQVISAKPLRVREGAGPSSLETELGLAELGPTQSATMPETLPHDASLSSRVALSPRVHREREDLYVAFEGRKWRVRAAGKASGTELRVNLLVSNERDPSAFFVDTVDLYAARQRTHFTKQAAEELNQDEEELRRELGVIVLEVENERRAAQAASGNAAKKGGEAMSEEERQEALTLLRDPKLLERVLEDLSRAGVVGEETNKLVSYLAATSRKLSEPLAVVIQSASAAGKTSLMDSVLALIPEEERVQYSAMTGQSLFYMSGQDLKHKVLAIVEEEGAERASYALKLLQSEGELTIASAGKDPATGKHMTHEYRVEGPVMIMLTTTAIDVDEELLNRCIVLTVDEGRDQTEAIHRRQRQSRTLSGQIEAEERRRIRRLHRNAQRLLRTVAVVNPYAMELRFPSHTTRTRRDHMKYLTLISAVTLLHQHQRPTQRVQHRGRTLEYIESTREDVEVATSLAHSVLGRSLDELPPQTRKLLYAIEAMVTERMIEQGVAQQYIRFTRRDVREWTEWGNSQLKVHMHRLEEMEYLLMHRLRGPLVQYELRYEGEGKDGGRFLIGLDSTYEVDRPGLKGDRPGLGRVPAGRRPVGGRDDEKRERSGEKPANGVAPHPAQEITTAVEDLKRTS